MSNFKDFTRAIAGIASALKGINTVIDDIPVSGGTGGGVDYSTEEQDTGRKWIDGSPIYQKTYAAVNLSGAGKTTLDTNTDIGIIVFSHTTITPQDPMSGSPTFLYAGGGNFRAEVTAAGDLKLQPGDSWTSGQHKGTCTIWYTKKTSE